MASPRETAPARDSVFAASIFNVGARSWEAFINLATVPVLLAQLGAEAYGLVGFTQSIFGLVGLLDFGLSNAVNRELARGETDAAGRRVVREIVRSLELPLLAVAVLLAIGLLGTAGFLATDFLRVETLSERSATTVLQLFAGVFFFRWISGFYRGVFFGLERQVRYNVFSVVYATLRFAGGAGLLVAGAIGVVGLFVWYLATDVLFFATLRLQVAAFERAGERTTPAFSSARLKAVLPYALGTMGLALVSVFVMQADKLLVARLRPLPELGAYTFAFSLAMGIRIVPGAIWAATFPRLVRARQEADEVRLRSHLVGAFQASSISALALAAPLAVFAPDIVATLGGGSAAIGLAAPLLSLLAIGVFVESLNGPSYQQMLADGHASAVMWLNLGISLGFVLSVWAGVAIWGAIGAAACWVGVQVVYLALYARQARSLGGPDLGGILLRVLPAFAGVIALAGVTRFLAAGSAPILGVVLAAGLAVALHVAGAWVVRRRGAA